MLSYQHIYHAGNLADLHKHALLASMLDYLVQKDKPLSYLETHAGRGLYDLRAPEAVKTGEAAAGILRARAAQWLADDHPLMRVLTAVRADHGPDAYPGSPLIAAHLLRPDDAMHLAELHPQEASALRDAMRPYPAHVHRRDGIEMAQSLCPPNPRRGLLLIDPSYEIKTDYATLPRTIDTLHRKWNVGVIALWYPILTHGAQGPMVAALRQAHPKALVHEVRFPPARPGHGMVGSGMVILNAPWGTERPAAELSRIFDGLSR